MLDFKKLAEVTSIEELPEGINVLVNDNGVVKQVPANKVGEMVPDILKKAAESGDGFGYTDGNELHQIDSKYIKREELVPEELSNAIETHGMGWTDEDDTVHQIDQKYIPSSGGGATVIDFVVDEQGSVNCEYTPTQFLALMCTAPLVCVLDATVVGFPAAMPIVPFFFMDNDDNEHGLSLYIRTTSGLKPIVQGILSDDEWEFGL